MDHFMKFHYFFSQEQKNGFMSENSPEKAIPLARIGLVELKEADKVFFDMVQHGWDGNSYDEKKHRFSGTFVWAFLCLLLKDKCPSETRCRQIFCF
jgi:hypothetical protein